MPPITPQTIALIVLGLLVIILSVWVIIIERRLKKLLSGKNAESLEGVIGGLGQDIQKLEAWREVTDRYLVGAENRLKRSVQGIETIRFNAFRGNGEGGNQSFAIALLSEQGDGTVISSLYTRDRVSVFAKPIKNYSSELEMTEEEKTAVNRARRQ